MIWGDHRRVSVKAIIAPGDLAERQGQAHVVALAQTFADYGGAPGNVPWVVKRRAGWELVAGRDRLAALMLNGAKHADVRVILEATRDELAELEQVENLYRRPVADRDKLIVAHLKKISARIEAGREANSETAVTKVGRPKTPRGEAREHLAAAMHTTPAALKQAEHREKVRGAAASSGSLAHDGRAVDVPPPPPIDCYGHAMPAHVREDVAPVLAALRKVDTLLRQAQAAAKELEATGILRGDLDAVRSALADAAAVVRAKTPTHLCPYCLGALQQGGCEACNVNGFVTRAVFLSAPAELRVGAEEFAAGLDPEPAAAKTPGEVIRRARKGITVEVAGETLTVEELEARADKVPF